MHEKWVKRQSLTQFRAFTVYVYDSRTIA